MTNPPLIVSASAPNALETAAELLAASEVVVLPTDSVYGIGVSVAHAADPKDLFVIKQRPADKAVPWLVRDASMLQRYCADVPLEAFALIQRFWPGALTLVLAANDEVPSSYLPSEGTIAFRMPNHPFVLQLMDMLESPLAVTSANMSGRPAAAEISELDPELVSKAALVVDGGRCTCGIASTVVHIHHGTYKVLRQGAVSEQEIEGCIHGQS